MPTMPQSAPSRAALDLLKQADNAARARLPRLIMDVPDEEVRLPNRLWLRNRQIEIRGTGPRSGLAIEFDGDEARRPHPLCIQPLDGEAIEHFIVRDLTLRLIISVDRSQGLGGLRVSSAKDQGVHGGEICNNTFLVETTLPLIRDAKSYLCHVGAQGIPVDGQWQRVRNVDVHDNVARNTFNKCFQFTYARHCRAFRNLVLHPATPQRGRDNFAFRIVAASDCVFRDNAMYCRGGGKAQMAGFSCNGLEPVPAERNVFCDNVIDTDAGGGVTLQALALDNRVERNQIIGHGPTTWNGIRLTSGEPDQPGGPITGNWFFDNRVQGFPTTLLIQTPGVIRDNRFVGRFDKVDDRSGGLNLILNRG